MANNPEQGSAYVWVFLCACLLWQMSLKQNAPTGCVCFTLVSYALPVIAHSCLLFSILLFNASFSALGGVCVCLHMFAWVCWCRRDTHTHACAAGADITESQWWICWHDFVFIFSYFVVFSLLLFAITWVTKSNEQSKTQKAKTKETTTKHAAGEKTGHMSTLLSIPIFSLKSTPSSKTRM